MNRFIPIILIFILSRLFTQKTNSKTKNKSQRRNARYNNRDAYINTPEPKFHDRSEMEAMRAYQMNMAMQNKNGVAQNYSNVERDQRYEAADSVKQEIEQQRSQRLDVEILPDSPVEELKSELEVKKSEEKFEIELDGVDIRKAMLIKEILDKPLAMRN